MNNRLNNLQTAGRSRRASVLSKHWDHARGLAFSLPLNRDRLADPGYSTKSWRANAFAWHELGRTTLSVTGTIGGLRADERLSLFPDRRKEDYRALSLSAQFRQFTAQSLAPFCAPLLGIQQQHDRHLRLFRDVAPNLASRAHFKKGE